MDKERQSKLSILNHLVSCCVRRINFLLLLYCCSNVTVVFAQTSTSVVSPDREQKSWIVGNNFTVRTRSYLVPGCTDLCLNAISPIYGETLVGLSVQLYPCQDSDNSLFQYNDSSKAITMWDSVFDVNRCLDAGQFPPRTTNTDSQYFTLEECNANATSQQWIFQENGQVKSGLVNSSSASSPLFMQGKSRQPEDWGKGWNTFGLYLSTTEKNSSTTWSFSFLPYAAEPRVTQNTVSPPSQPSIGSTSYLPWIENGDFADCGFDPGQSSRTDFSSQTWWFTICSWIITSGSVQLLSPDFWQNDQRIPKGAGMHNTSTLHLNGYGGPGAITQLIYTEPGSNYSLSFDFAGDVTFSCGSSIKTLNVSISPSSLQGPTSLSFNVSDKTPAAMGWMSASLLNFTAYGTSINFTFQSTTDGSCGPLIDNVAVRKLSAVREKAGNGSALSKVLTVTVAVLAVGLLIPSVFCCSWMWRRRHNGDVDTAFIKGIRCPSEMDTLEVGFKSGSSSFSGVFGNQYSWEELETATSNFAKVLGNGGGSCLLYLAEFPDGLFGVVKVESDAHRRQPTSHERFKQEVAILRRLHHAYLVNFIGVCIGEGSRRALIFEYMPNGNLFDRLHRLQGNEPLSWQIRMVIAYQVACALEYLHEEASPPVVHRDVQASNVLLQRDDSAKLAAFYVLRTGRSCVHSSFDSTVSDTSVVRYGYLDPVYHTTGRISKKNDVYSYGVLLLELITGIPAADLDSKPYADLLTNTEEMVNIVDPKLLGKFNKHELIEVIDIVVKCLKPERKSRPSMSDVVFMLRAGFSSSRPLAYE